MKSLFAVSTMTLVGLYALLSIVLLAVCLICDIPMIYGVGAAIIVLIIQFLISPFITDITIKWFYKAHFDAEIPEYLENFIKEVCAQEKMKYPRVGVIDDGAPNAFTYGHTKNDARVVITRGLMELLNEDEVKAVVGHELGHATHYDMLFMTVAQLVPLVLYFIYLTLTDSDNDKDGKAAIVGVIAYILYIISEYIILWLSRTREYYADEFSVKTTKNPNSLASALVKVGFGLSLQGDSKKSTSKLGALGIFDSKTSKSLVVSTNNNQDDHTMIKNAMKWEMWNPWAFIYQLGSTHPLISKRLIAISKYSQEFGQEPYIVFDLQKPESYVDDFFFEVFIKYLPVLIVIVTVAAVFLLPNFTKLVIGVGGILLMLSLLGLFNRSHRKGYQKSTVRDLLGEVKVSGVTSVSCEVEGEIIGKGNPGCIFSEDFIIKDETGIIFLDYNQPLWIINKIFALFKSQEYFNKIVKVKGWYRRSPVPYIEIYEYEVDGKTKKVFTYGLTKGIYYALLVLFIAILILGVL
ncbi:MAG: M48 family metalloprotease [Bacilli bacterium]|nr:M48 family metalloprotease [Bacilli bacterium]